MKPVFVEVGNSGKQPCNIDVKRKIPQKPFFGIFKILEHSLLSFKMELVYIRCSGNIKLETHSSGLQFSKKKGSTTILPATLKVSEKCKIKSLCWNLLAAKFQVYGLQPVAL